ncbi:RagB/SusD family nutrient uptake outer membrane protein [Prolixibacteraceae bacterium JC049]|nr:RagB/SusD family nutrient uptake outer membrane protein [Prolixibacteraceae bacterium JC049]
MKKYQIISLFILLAIVTSCNDWLDRKPYNILGNDDVWKQEDVALGVLANLYSRMPVDAFNKGGYHGEFSNAEYNMLISDEAMWSGDRNGLNGVRIIGGGVYNYWDYGYIRHLNLFIEKATESSLGAKEQLIAEARFLRAFTYFEMVKRFGGVPLVTKSFGYVPGEPVTELQVARATEEETYNFIASELDAVVDVLPADKNFRRATKWSALALKSRAMLYAASLAKYNNQMASPVVLPGKEVGISAGKANEYYTTSFNASKQIITEGGFQLNASYFDVFNKKDANEMIMARDFSAPDLVHNFTLRNTTPSLAKTENNGANITPYLEMVEEYEMLDGTSGKINFTDADGNSVHYTNVADAFAGRDRRLAATVLFGGAEFKGKTVNVQAGQKVWNSSTNSYETKSSNTLGEKDGEGRLILGLDGPSNDKNITNTGFYIKKFISTESGAGLITTQATNYWPIFRYAEILLNAAEAGMELNKAEAVGYINELRERAGFGANSIETLTMEKVMHERKVELAYEGHRYFDLKRWRKSEEVISGKQYHGLYPYLVINEGDVNHLKYVFEKVEPARLYEDKVFERKNYYTYIPTGAVSKNPKLVLNPGQ